MTSDLLKAGDVLYSGPVEVGRELAVLCSFARKLLGHAQSDVTRPSCLRESHVETTRRQNFLIMTSISYVVLTQQMIILDTGRVLGLCMLGRDTSS